MKFGKSLLLSELLDAKDVEYDDVSKNRFWIVCPACTEPIFKVIRNAESDKPALHYFSHYEASKAYASDCELRVGRITQREVEQMAIQSRDQKLRFFTASLKALIREDLHTQLKLDPRMTQSHFRVMARSHAIADLRKIMYENLKKLTRFSHDELLAAFDEALEMIGKDEKVKFDTNLTLQTQKRIAVDLLNYLRTPPGHPTFDTLFDHAFTWQRRRLSNNIRINQEIGYERDVYDVMRKLLTTSRNKARLLLASLLQKKLNIPHLEGDSYLTQFMHNLASEMLIILIRLPYLDLLRKSLREKQMTSGSLPSAYPALVGTA